MSFDPKYTSEALPLGEQAHIIAKESSGPRGDSVLSSEERDTYDNLILVCPTDHVRIDRAVADYPVEKLHLLKTQHELWVQEQLAGHTDPDVPGQIYAALLDAFVEGCAADRWERWTSRAVELEPIWGLEIVDGTRKFEIAVFSAVWPGKYPELERALTTLATITREARETFLRHAVLEGPPSEEIPAERTHYRGPKFYKELRVRDEDLYKARFREWREWQTKSQALIFEATRAGNWVADCGRKFINPGFFAVSGRFRLFCGVLSDLPGDLWVPEYIDEERSLLPQGIRERFASYRELFPFRLRPDD